MPGIIKIQNNTTERNRLARSILAAVREMVKQTEPNNLTYDLAAFIALALEQMNKMVETTTAAWEKRGYWVKADKFRLEWEWTESCRKQIGSALDHQEWGNLAIAVSKVAEKLAKVKLSPNSRIGSPWNGAWEVYKKQKSRQ
jgi:hypothetical protein